MDQGCTCGKWREAGPFRYRERGADCPVHPHPFADLRNAIRGLRDAFLDTALGRALDRAADWIAKRLA